MYTLGWERCIIRSILGVLKSFQSFEHSAREHLFLGGVLRMVCEMGAGGAALSMAHECVLGGGVGGWMVNMKSFANGHDC